MTYFPFYQLRAPPFAEQFWVQCFTTSRSYLSKGERPMRIKQIISALLTACMLSTVTFIPVPAHALMALEEEGSGGGDPETTLEEIIGIPNDPTPDPTGEATMTAALAANGGRASRIEHRFGTASQCQAVLIALDVVGGYGGEGGLPRVITGTLTCSGRTLFRVW
jgi:hypothetical protein